MTRRRITVRRTIRVQRTIRWTTQQNFQQHREVASRFVALPRTVRQVATLVDEGFGPIDDGSREFDLFLSHASENRDFVRPLAQELESRGVRVWYDETNISVGDSLRESIDLGLSRSRFGVVVFSEEFFAKKWTNYELNGLVTREVRGKKVILPIWHPEFGLDDLIRHSPSLADKRALRASEFSISEIADQLRELVKPIPT